MGSVYEALRGFALAHRACGELRGDADPIELHGYRVWAACSCGARLERWVTPDDAQEDLLRTDLLTFEN
jgi:hypothetical protein